MFGKNTGPGNKPPSFKDFENSTVGEIEEQDINEKFYQMFEGTGFDEKLDEMIQGQLDSGMTDDQIIQNFQKTFQTIEKPGSKKGEMQLDLSNAVIPDDMFKEFEKVMEGSKDSDEFKDVFQSMKESVEVQDEDDEEESDAEFLKK